MLELGLPRIVVISTLTLAATLVAGAAQAEPPPPPPVLPAAAPAPLPPPSAAPPAAPIDAKRPAKPGHVYTPPGYPEPPEEGALGDDSIASPRSHAVPPGFELGYGSPPPAYGLPQSDAISFEQQPEYPPETQMRSAGLVAGGVVLLSFGVVGLAAGSAMVAAHEPTANQPNVCNGCNFDGSGGSFSSPRVILKPGFAAAGTGTLIGSVVAIGASIPLIVIGAKKVPYVDSASPAARAARLTPSIGVGPASATLRWQF